jgi:putative ABC transport system permease protein
MLPLGGRIQHFVVAGVWRDYARSAGAIVIDRGVYIAATRPRAPPRALWLALGRCECARRRGRALRAAIRRARRRFEITDEHGVRERSLQIFDRAFAITYALEAIAVLIGLTGVSFAASSTALARRAEFGMLRHIGMLRGRSSACSRARGFC